jgi:hypothetical protein
MHLFPKFTLLAAVVVVSRCLLVALSEMVCNMHQDKTRFEELESDPAPSTPPVKPLSPSRVSFLLPLLSLGHRRTSHSLRVSLAQTPWLLRDLCLVVGIAIYTRTLHLLLYLTSTTSLTSSLPPMPLIILPDQYRDRRLFEFPQSLTVTSSHRIASPFHD